MGNRATLEVISANYTGKESECHIYVHWDGSPDTVKKLVGMPHLLCVSLTLAMLLLG